MRVVVVGATGNVGTSVLESLAGEGAVDEVVGIARRRPGLRMAKTSFVEADIAEDDLEPHLRGADAVVHLAWVIQPSRDEATLHRINVGGSARLFDAAARAGVPAIVYASSIGAYAPGPKNRAVDESWSTAGIPSSWYSRHKSAVERILDGFEAVHPEVRVVRLRPALVFKREAASGIRRLFIGPLLPSPLLRRGLVPLLPAPARGRAQAVHSKDLADAYRRAILDEDARGAYNVAAEPVLDMGEVARLLGARTVPVPAAVIRAATDATWRAHLQPTPPGWLDLALGVPIMDTGRIRRELAWSPRRTSSEAFLELFAGLRESAGLDTPPLAPDTGGPLRLRELLSGVGGTSR
ncbi:MAG: NAD-dependent epimerase/dehydratase family protein [Actinomycetota bacterium]|nr:NAD-dependent epimerase/dehydratase family protein [Actinomycetota bacterium]